MEVNLEDEDFEAVELAYDCSLEVSSEVSESDAIYSEEEEDDNKDGLPQHLRLVEIFPTSDSNGTTTSRMSLWASEDEGELSVDEESSSEKSNVWGVTWWGSS